MVTSPALGAAAELRAQRHSGARGRASGGYRQPASRALEGAAATAAGALAVCGRLRQRQHVEVKAVAPARGWVNGRGRERRAEGGGRGVRRNGRKRCCWCAGAWAGWQVCGWPAGGTRARLGSLILIGKANSSISDTRLVRPEATTPP